jgi:hypothetical protein
MGFPVSDNFYTYPIVHSGWQDGGKQRFEENDDVITKQSPPDFPVE